MLRSIEVVPSELTYMRSNAFAESSSPIHRIVLQLAKRSGCSLLGFHRESEMYRKSKRTPRSDKGERTPPQLP